MRLGLFQGSFDPITKGHIDCIKRSLNICDKIIVLLAINKDKNYLFNMDERLYMAKESLKNIENVTVDKYDGLTAEYAKSHNVDFFIRGLRNEKDYIYEKEIEYYNKNIAPNIETIYITCDKAYEDVSSTKVRECIKNGIDISKYVDESIIDFIKRKER